MTRRSRWTGRRRPPRGAAATLPPRSVARLLDPRGEVVGFVGRANELGALAAWCADDLAGRLRIVTGPAGVGKTRLAVALAGWVRSLGWHTEQVADGGERRAIPELGRVTSGRALLVVDHAETRAGLDRLVTELAGPQGAGARVLLLARSAGDWCDRLGMADPAAWELVQAAREAAVDLPAAVAAGLSDAEMAAHAATSFARVLGLPERRVIIHGGPARRRVLDLHAAALAAVLAGDGSQTVHVDVGDVLGELLRHEQHYWYDRAQAFGLGDGQPGATPRALRQVIAAACLLGAATEEEACALPGRVPGMAPSAAIAGWLRELYPPGRGRAGWIGSLQPDRVAERHTVRQLIASPELAEACLTGLGARQVVRAVRLLAGATEDYPEAAELLELALTAAVDGIDGTPAPVDALTVIFGTIPSPAGTLAPAATALCQRIVNLLPADADPGLRAFWAGALGARLSELGRPGAALAAARDAVARYRELVAAGPDRYRPGLAASLSTLGAALSQLGRPADALAAEQEALVIRRGLAAAMPARHRPDLAASLSSLGARFSAMARPADALAAEQEAVAIRRVLAAADPGRYRPDLAASLSGLGGALSAMGRPADALAAAREAAGIGRVLAAADPGRYRPDLAASLTSLGACLSELGRPAEALAAAEEAAAIRRELAAADPGRYRPALAGSLANLGICLSEVGRPAEALPVTEEAVAIRRELAAADPGRHRPALAASLSSLGARLSELGRPAGALPVTLEAVAIRRELAAADPGRYRPALAASLANLGGCLSELGRPAEALPVTEEAVAIRRELAAADPGRHRPGLAASLAALGILLSELGRPADALAAEQEAVAIDRELAAADPGRYRQVLAAALSNLGLTLAELGYPADALAAEQEAVVIHRELAAGPGPAR